jgi:hypothetical protein
MPDNDRLTPLDPIDDPDLRSIDAMLTRAGNPWRQMNMHTESAQQFLASLAAWESAAGTDEIPPARISMPPISHAHTAYGGHVMARPSRITAFLAVALTICLIAASAGIFVVLNRHQSSGPVAHQITPTPTPRGPLVMPANITDLAMVSDHEGWAMQMKPGSLDQNLLHFHNGRWQTVTLPGLSSSYSGTLAMTTASDGWLLASTEDPTTQDVHQFLYHYDGMAWSQVAMPTLHGTGMSILTAISLGPNGDDWMAGEYINNGSKMQSEQRLTPDSTLSCLPNCGSSLLLHLVGGRWTEVLVPAGVNITPESVSMGWFEGNTSDPTSLYHYQNGKWSRVPIDVAPNYPNGISMITPTDGWIQVTNPDTSSPAFGNSTIYHFNGTAVQRVAELTPTHCTREIGSLGGISTTSPDDAWVPSGPDCKNESEIWHLHGKDAIAVALPAPYDDAASSVQQDAEGNLWLLVARIDVSTPIPLRPGEPDFTHEAILRWNGSQWVIFAQTQG